ncbi:Methyl-CpG-binding domain-containing protein 6 [Morus notabilis]|uniref:Methyl-CpG-binding domain-containing protein 6 n=1 Tax=Morus notabilis TaxID=981085 RepID=W9S289_9ROSA|nr:methyl-CpG-binding domain-containing protein 5 [Morus notabilis]EXC10657.1 Methyl-CpG-binding domain-containing protein 6 [Morus notabilis]
MSATATSAQNPGPNTPKSDSDRLAASLPPDPLLRSGSFIDASTATGNGGSSFDDRKSQKLFPQTPESRRSSGGALAPCSESPNRGKRKPPEAELDWLPRGWTVEDKVRSSGATAGSKDRYYFDPVSGLKFRSKKEVLYFLETGIRRKHKKTTEISDAEITPMDSSGEQKQNSSTSKKGSALNFNFSRVPEKVKWVLSDSSGESWNAFIGDNQVPESSTRDWLAAFTFLASRDRGRYH